MVDRMNWGRNRERRHRERHRNCEINPHASERTKSAPKRTKVIEKDGRRVVMLTSRRGQRLDRWEAAQAASPGASLDPNSPEFREIVARYGKATGR